MEINHGESRRFTERRMKVQKKRKILAVGDQTESRFEGDADEIEMVYIHGDDVIRPSLTCDGLVCIPVPGSVNVLNPSTGEFLSFPSGPDPPVTNPYGYPLYTVSWWHIFPGYWAMGFGMDKVNGSYKIVRMFFNPYHYCEILDVNIGEWRKVSPPSYKVDARRKSACVNGSIYWLELFHNFCLLALDLHTEEFRDVPPPPICSEVDQLANLEDRLAIAKLNSNSNQIVEIWIIDAHEETWTMIHSINLRFNGWLRPLTVSKEGNIFFYDNKKRLLKYYPETDFLCCLASDICVISPFVENLVPLPKTSGYRSGFQYLDHASGSQISKILRRTKLRIPNILITTSLVSLVIFRYFVVLSRS